MIVGIERDRAASSWNGMRKRDKAGEEARILKLES
jgi:hypothetical protein